MKDMILHLLNGRLKQAIQCRRTLTGVVDDNLILPIIDRWVGTGRGNSEDRKALKDYLDKNFPR